MKHNQNQYKVCGLALTLALAVVAASLTSCSNGKRHEKQKSDAGCVYVCSGPQAKRYHSTRDCYGLSRCSGEIVETTIEEAEDNGRTPCRMCPE